MAGDLLIRFWDAERLLLQRPGRWQVRSWPDWQLLANGDGTAVAEPAGNRVAVAVPDGTIRVDGSAALALPPAAGRLTDLAWSEGGLVVAARAAAPPDRPDPTGASARPFGAPPAERSSLWRVSLNGTSAARLYDAPLGTRIWAVHALGGEVLVEHYPYGDRGPPLQDIPELLRWGMWRRPGPDMATGLMVCGSYAGWPPDCRLARLTPTEEGQARPPPGLQ
jgi:hypothetical protein